MKTFTLGGKTWTIDLNVDSIEQVKERAKANLLDITNTALFEELADNPRRLVDILWVLIEEQAEKHNVTPRDFARGMRGEAIDLATKALLEELCDFFPPRQSSLLRRLLEKSDAAKDLAMEEIDRKMQALTPKKILEMTLARASSGSSGNAPESSESIPAGLNSDS